MDYKEKYEQAFNRAKIINPGTADYEVAVKIFPELKSEDERIRKALLNEFIHLQSKGYKFAGLEGEEIVTWLEKQGDISPTEDELEALRIAAYESVKNWSEKLQSLYLKLCRTQIEQKPDKVEPKFKVGDWIYHEISSNTFRINKIENGLYVSVEGATISLGRQNDWRLWTIQDAKGGDVLATDNGSICIFDGTVEDGKYPFAYCGLTGHYGFEVYDRKLPFTHNNDVHPATKEQRDLLFSKMKEVGYEWDAEKKELKNERQDGQKYDNKIEPKFKVNDWITDGTSTFQIVEIRDEWYIADDGDRVRFDIIDQYYHLWTIQDAKPGDVLVDDKNNIGIFKSFGSYPDGGSNNDDSYCYLFCKLSDGFFYPEFENNTIMYSFCGIHPANREQYELLLQKMKEAAYEFDSGKK